MRLFWLVAFFCLNYSFVHHLYKESQIARLEMEATALEQSYQLLIEEERGLEYLTCVADDPHFLIEMSFDPCFGHLRWVNQEEIAVQEDSRSIDYCGFAALYP